MICKIFRRSKMGCDIPTDVEVKYVPANSTVDIYDYMKAHGLSLVDYGYVMLSKEDVDTEVRKLGDQLYALHTLLVS